MAATSRYRRTASSTRVSRSRPRFVGEVSKGGRELFREVNCQSNDSTPRWRGGQPTRQPIANAVGVSSRSCGTGAGACEPLWHGRLARGPPLGRKSLLGPTVSGKMGNLCGFCGLFGPQGIVSKLGLGADPSLESTVDTKLGVGVDFNRYRVRVGCLRDPNST